MGELGFEGRGFDTGLRVVGIIVRKFFLHRGGNGGEVGFRFGGLYVGLHTRKQTEHAHLAIANHVRTGAEGARGGRHVHVVFVRILRKWREHADDGVGLVVHAKNFADYRGIAAEAAEPEFVAEKQDGGGALSLVAGSKISAEKRFGAEDIKKIPGDYAGFDLFWFSATQKDELHVVVFDDGVQAAILAAIVEHFGNGN